MSEIEKMYARAMIEPLSIIVRGVGEQIINYPPFTAEIQLEIIIFLINRKQPLLFSLDEGQGKISRRIFEEGLAGIVNKIWQDLTEEEQEQVKGILK